MSLIIKHDDNIGRYAVAGDDLKAGQTIFTELPFTYGPKSECPPLCLGCLIPVDCSTLCTKCNWPVCGVDCEKFPIHRDNECGIFEKAGVKFQPVDDFMATCLQYECITPLRVLLTKEKNNERWTNEIEIMESHNNKRKDKPIWEFNKINIVDYLRGPCKLDRFTEDLIHTICGILEVNAFEARTPAGYMIRCLYPKLAILSHNCISNITHTIDSEGNGNEHDYNVIVRASIDIKKEQQLYSSYTYSLWPTLVRREYLKESKYFDCKCERCNDKTEKGTHLGTLKCNKCDNGIILSTDPLNNDCEWNCTHCEFKTNAFAIGKVYATVQSEIDSIELISEGSKVIEAREELFKKYHSIFHPKNAYMQILRIGLSQWYGRADNYTMDDLPDILLERKIELCQQLLEVLNIIEPGYTRIRGITLYEMHAPLMMLARHQYNYQTIDKEQLKRKLQDAIDVLEQSVEILKGESPTTSEGQLGLMADQALQSLKDNFDLLIETA